MDEALEEPPAQLADLPDDAAESPRAAPDEPPVVVVKPKPKARARAKASAPEPPPPPPPEPKPEPKAKARAKAKAKVKAAPAPAPTPESDQIEPTASSSFPTFNDPVALLAAALHGAREQESQRRLQLYETFVFGKR